MSHDAALTIEDPIVEHYETAAYGGLVQLAITIGYGKVADLSEKTLQEEEDIDCDLTEIAETYINFYAE